MARLLLVCFEASEVVQMGGFAQSSGMPFDVLVLSGTSDSGIGAEKTLAAGLPSLPPADFLANALAQLSDGYTWIAGLSSMQSKDALARLAGKLDCPMVTDVLSIEGENKFTRPMVAGSVIATVEVEGSPVVMTVRPNGFSKAESKSAGATEAVKLAFAGKTKRLSQSSRDGGRPDLAQAKVVVSGGRPLKDAETFEKIIGGLADKLGGAVGATRAAVDCGIAANELQVGQTGKIVAPDLYIAAGISGSTQHMAGIKDSKVIVAINNDPDAPIFDSADIGLVADLFQAVPDLTEKLS